MEVRIETYKDMITTRRGKHCRPLQEITAEERRWMRLTTFNILAPTEWRGYNIIVCSSINCVSSVCRLTTFRREAPPRAIPPPIVSTVLKSPHCMGITVILVTSDDLVRICQIIIDADSSESSSSLTKYRSQKRPTFMFAWSCCEK